MGTSIKLQVQHLNSFLIYNILTNIKIDDHEGFIVALSAYKLTVHSFSSGLKFD